MQLVGIGFASLNWNSLLKQLQNNVSHQLNGKLFNELTSKSEAEISSKRFEELTADILKLKADWVLFSPEAFESPKTCIKILDALKEKSVKDVRFVIVLDDILHDLSVLLKLQPVIELVNKMQFKLSVPELLLSHHIRSFPRIRLDDDFQTMDYTNLSGILVRQSANDVPLNTLIPLTHIRKLETKDGALSPENWLQNVLQKQDKVAHPEQVAGILREKKGCYLFPGIPFNSIQNLKFENTKVEHLIRLDECTLKNPPFKRFIEDMNKEHKTWLKENHEKPKTKSPKIHGSGKYLIVNSLLEILFKEIGQTNVNLSTKDESAKELQNSYLYWLRLDDSSTIKLNGSTIDWSIDLSQILAPLNNFVELIDLQVDSNSHVMPIQKMEFEKMQNDLMNDEASLKTKLQHAESNQLLYEQEQDVLQKINVFSKMLIEALSASTAWETAVDTCADLKMSRALLLCEDENMAADLNLKLSEVQRKLWINPFKFQQAEDLAQFNTKMTLSYLKPEALIVTDTARTHLENLCHQALEDEKQAESVLKEQIKIIEQAKIDSALILKNKTNLALRWLHVSLKQLLYRDRHLFQNLTEKAA